MLCLRLVYSSEKGRTIKRLTVKLRKKAGRHAKGDFKRPGIDQSIVSLHLEDRCPGSLSI